MDKMLNFLLFLFSAGLTLAIFALIIFLISGIYSLHPAFVFCNFGMFLAKLFTWCWDCYTVVC